MSYSEYGNKIKQWLREEGLQTVDKPDETSNLTFDVKSGPNVITIGFLKKSIDSMIVAAQLEFNENERKILRYLKTRSDIMWDLQKFLVQMHLEPIFIPSKTKIEKIYFQRIIYFDGLTKHSFYETMADIFHSINILRETFLKLGESGPEVST